MPPAHDGPCGAQIATRPLRPPACPLSPSFPTISLPAASRRTGNDAFRLKVWFISPSEAGEAEGAAVERERGAEEVPEAELDLTPP